MREHDNTGEDGSRRPLASRGTRWAQGLAHALLKTSITPNGISLAGVGFAGAGGLAFAFAPGAVWLFIVGAVFVQLRLLCNLLDGMVAVEGGRGSPDGALYNEIPDRIEDSLLLIGFGYASGVPVLGFIAALLAVATAYLRAFGASLGLGQDYRGPMAKPHRMAALTVGSLLAVLEVVLLGSFYAPLTTLVIIVIGTAWTCVRRIARLADGVGRRP